MMSNSIQIQIIFCYHCKTKLLNFEFAEEIPKMARDVLQFVNFSVLTFQLYISFIKNLQSNVIYWISPYVLMAVPTVLYVHALYERRGLIKGVALCSRY